MLRYAYALSSAGRFIGHDILGRFFKTADRTAKFASAQKYFYACRHMVRPVERNSEILKGTLTDGEVLLCSDKPGPRDPMWGMVVFVKSAQLRTAVLLPVPDNVNATMKYNDFLSNAHTELYCLSCHFDRAEKVWEGSATARTPLSWPKSVFSYPSANDEEYTIEARTKIFKR